MSAWVCFQILFANIKVASIELYVVPRLKGLGALWMALWMWMLMLPHSTLC